MRLLALLSILMTLSCRSWVRSGRTDEDLHSTLIRHAWRTPRAAHWASATDEAASRALQGTKHTWHRTNPTEASSGVSLFLIDAATVVPIACHELGRDSRWCRGVRYVENNCAVLTIRVIACDTYFMWKLNRDAFRTAMALRSEVRAQQEEILKLADGLRTKFFDAEVERPSSQQLLADLERLDAVVAGNSELRTGYARAFAGMWHVILFHELGHIVSGHMNGAAFPPCANDATVLRDDALVTDFDCSVCGPPLTIESEADSWSAARMRKFHERDAEFAANLFIENYSRAAHGLDLYLKRHSLSGSEHYVKAWMRFVATGSHPAWIARFANFSAHDSVDVKPITDNRMSFGNFLKEYMNLIDQLCRSHCPI
jgi:hypothetical protein